MSISLLYFAGAYGDIAQLIRAQRWQRWGRGFESLYLHQYKNPTLGRVFILENFIAPAIADYE